MSSPIGITLAAKLFYAMAGNGPSASQLDSVIYPLVEKIGKPGGPETYSQLIDEIAKHFAGADWVYSAGFDVREDCQRFTHPGDWFETPSGRNFPLSWVNNNGEKI